MFMKPTRVFEVVRDLLIVTDIVPLVCGMVFVCGCIVTPGFTAHVVGDSVQLVAGKTLLL